MMSKQRDMVLTAPAGKTELLDDVSVGDPVTIFTRDSKAHYVVESTWSSETVGAQVRLRESRNG